MTPKPEIVTQAMSRLQIILLASFFCAPLTSMADTLKVGSDIERTSIAMKDAGYQEAALAMLSKDRTKDLQFWSVDEGFLIVLYSTKTKEIIRISYRFEDERPLLTRKTFEFEVKSFDTVSGEMTIETKRPKGVQQGDTDQQPAQSRQPKH